ncbi:Hint domain-containing protein [Pseudooceanicola sp. MF1-13]|uniref:Hint domain-containing protein n=1 Tax=Pseudooceanicola sp. MF1-13 TaxID=3379095 RepID=UPI003892589C
MTAPMKPHFAVANSLSDNLSHATSTTPVLRPYQVMYMNDAGRIEDREVRAPATPDFQSAFTAFAHGSLITTAAGEVAVEDLRPGMKVVTRERGAQEVMWIGIMTHVVTPNSTPFLTRVTAGRFGPAQPAMDILAGPGARMLHRPSGAHYDSGDKLAYTPLRDFIDGDSVIAIAPRMAIDTYHIALRRHGTIRVGGLDMETFHPGMTLLEQMGYHTRDLFMSMFPHLRRASDFGRLAHPRLTMDALGGAAA